MLKSKKYDVVICGGGKAGLTLGRQLKRKMPDLSVAILDKFTGQIEAATHKVGEATVEGGAHYLSEVLGLTGYFNKNHLHKLGLRLFFGDSHGPFENRPEIGTRKFPRVTSYQVDRGIFERDLRTMNREMGIEILEGVSVTDIQLSEGDGLHQVSYKTSGDEKPLNVQANWVIDAMGRRRYLQRKLGLHEPSPHNASAVWWRLKGEYDIQNIEPASNPAWTPPTQERRWFSTNHLMGKGYWIWIIPLASGNTSMGLVTDERIHPFKSYHNWELMREFLREHEPALDKYIGEAEPLDFLKMKDFSYLSKQIFSANRWSCVGEAGIFLDPFYSPGADFIAYSNFITTRMIELERQGELTTEIVEKFNRYILKDLTQLFIQMYKDNYEVFGSTAVMFTKVVWDTCFYWAFPTQMMFQGLLTEPKYIDEFSKISNEFLEIQEKMQAFFREWGPRTNEPDSYTFTDYAKIPFCAGLHLELLNQKSPEKTFADMRENIKHFREWYQATVRQNTLKKEELVSI